MLYGLNSCNVKCQLHVSKAGKKKPKIKQNKTLWDLPPLCFIIEI